jgi:hypothetical protein
LGEEAKRPMDKKFDDALRSVRFCRSGHDLWSPR